jgi:hypothetical protein
MFHKTSKYEAEVDVSVVSLISSSLRYLHNLDLLNLDFKNFLLPDMEVIRAHGGCDRSAEDAYSS